MVRAVAKIVLLAALFAAATATAAHADYRDLIMDACREDERVDGTYSQKDYREALANLSDDQLQYTDCEAILRGAQRAAARAQSGNGGAGATEIDKLIAGAGGDPLAGATQQERTAVEQAVKQAAGQRRRAGGGRRRAGRAELAGRRARRGRIGIGSARATARSARARPARRARRRRI